jgi:hypothetical protein
MGSNSKSEVALVMNMSQVKDECQSPSLKLTRSQSFVALAPVIAWLRESGKIGMSREGEKEYFWLVFMERPKTDDVALKGKVPLRNAKEREPADHIQENSSTFL